jgi:DnaJ-class molecular chaperone
VSSKDKPKSHQIVCPTCNGDGSTLTRVAGQYKKGEPVEEVQRMDTCKQCGGSGRVKF